MRILKMFATQGSDTGFNLEHGFCRRGPQRSHLDAATCLALSEQPCLHYGGSMNFWFAHTDNTLDLTILLTPARTPSPLAHRDGTTADGSSLQGSPVRLQEPEDQPITINHSRRSLSEGKLCKVTACRLM